MRLLLLLVSLSSLLLLAARPATAACTTTEYINGTICSVCTDTTQNQCIGCDGKLPPSGQRPVIYDICQVCNGNGQCVGCDGTQNGVNYDECGVCGGDGSTCASSGSSGVVTFDPPDSTAAGVIYKLPLTVTFKPATAGADIHYSVQFIVENGTQTQVPPNFLSPKGVTITVEQNLTVKAFAFKKGLRVGPVATALYRVSVTGSQTGDVGLLLPGYVVALIVIGGVLLVVVLVTVVVLIRVNNRKKLTQIRLDAAESVAKNEHYRAVFEYKAQNPDELELKVGDVLAVTSKMDDGWWEGSSYRLRGRSGVFPGNYVELIPPERLMWSERPKTVFGRISQRVSNFFGGAPEYGQDPQVAPHSKVTERVSRMFGVQSNASQNVGMSKLPPKPSGLPPARPGSSLPPPPKGNNSRY